MLFTFEKKRDTLDESLENNESIEAKNKSSNYSKYAVQKMNMEGLYNTLKMVESMNLNGFALELAMTQLERQKEAAEIILDKYLNNKSYENITIHNLESK